MSLQAFQREYPAAKPCVCAFVNPVSVLVKPSSMATPISHFDTGHLDTVHDSQFDYYGQRLATCSSDGIVRIFAVDQEPAAYVADLTGHQGPVWQVAWGHPKFGNIIASAGFDHTVIVWKEDQSGNWFILHRTDANQHTGVHLKTTGQRAVRLRLPLASARHHTDFF